MPGLHVTEQQYTSGRDRLFPEDAPPQFAVA